MCPASHLVWECPQIDRRHHSLIERQGAIVQVSKSKKHVKVGGNWDTPVPDPGLPLLISDVTPLCMWSNEQLSTKPRLLGRRSGDSKAGNSNATTDPRLTLTFVN